jgi:hypothetical protein
MEQTRNAGMTSSLRATRAELINDRFFHKMTIDPPYKSAFPHSEIPNVTPTSFGETWEQNVAEWGGHMKAA